jgi:single-stranded-DNA-specific exonuclease
MTNSLKGRTWVLNSPDEDIVQGLVATGLNNLQAQILAGRNITPANVANFMDPSLKAMLPDPSFFLDMDIAADRLVNAILEEEKIAVWSDYDVDGAASAAVLGRFLQFHGADYQIYIPDRITEGYGPNTKGLQFLADKGTDLVCVLDSGTTAFDPLEDAFKMGLDVVVVDHHMAEDTLPNALAVVNPNRKDQKEGYGNVCAAGMTFLLVVAANKRLRQAGHEGIPLMPLVGIVALATVCDVVGLTGLNRSFVAKGLPLLSKRLYPGIKFLCDAAEITSDITAGHCGFGLGPRINAGGRIGDPTLGARLLITDSDQEAEGIAETLNSLNRERQALEKVATASALEQLQGTLIPGTSREIALVTVEGHEGIIGISAARVKDAFDCPTFVLAQGEDGLLKGSGRSVSGFDLGSAVVEARQLGILVKGGGHAMAAGLSLDPAKFEEFRTFMNAKIKESDYAQTGVVLKPDTQININDLTVKMIEELDSLGPFGMGNPTPKVVLRNVRVKSIFVMKDKHLKITFQDAGGTGNTAQSPLWNVNKTDFGNAIMDMKNKVVDIVCALEVNEWNNNKSIQLKLEDIQLCSVDMPEDDMVPF